MFRLSILVVTLFATSLTAAENSTWPDFRGPTGNGRAASDKLPTRWSENSNIRWKVKTEGEGWSTPIVWKNQIWLTSATKDGTKMFAVGYDGNTGKVIKRVPLLTVRDPEKKNKLNSYASPSPAVSGDVIYFSFGTYGLCAFDLKAQRIRWMQVFKIDHQEGPGSSVVAHANMVICHYDGRDQQFVLALNKRDGRMLWKLRRSIDLKKVPDYSRKAFTTPYIMRTPNGYRMISPAAQGCYCYDPDTGQELWRVRYKGFSAVPRPVVFGNLVFVVNDYARPQIVAIRLGKRGDITDKHVAWKYPRNGPAMASPVLSGGRLLFVSNRGIVTCINAKTGKGIWTKRIGGNFSASPIVAGKLAYFFDRAGKATVIEVGDKPKVVAVNKLKEGMMASPSVLGDRLVLRTRGHLYCVGK